MFSSGKLVLGAILWIVACLLVVGVVTSTSAVQAAPLLQTEEPSPQATLTLTSPTPTPARIPTNITTVVPFPPSLTPVTPIATATPIPPPDGGGRVLADALFVREEPSFAARVMGLLGHGDSVFPIGRNSDASWIAINWGDSRGWVFANLILWDKKLDLMTLPTLSDSALTPEAATQASITQVGPLTPSSTITATPTLAETAAITPKPAVTSTSRPTSTRTPTMTSTPELAVVMPQPTSAPVASPPTSSGGTALPPGGLIGLGVFGMGILAGGGFYLQARASAARELRRYRDGFVFSVCPVCREGHIQLDEVVRVSFGVKRVKRTVRCDSCHSVLREVRPGSWRYSIDSYANPQMAERYSNKTLTDSDLAEFQDRTLKVAQIEPIIIDLPDPDWVKEMDVDQNNQPPEDQQPSDMS